MTAAEYIAVFTAPIWFPFALLLVYLLVALGNLCVDGLFFLAESYLGKAFRPAGPVRVLLAPFALILYPIAITLEMGFFFLVYLGNIPLSVLARARISTDRMGLKVLLGLLAPLWFIPGLLFLLGRFYVFVVRMLLDLRRPRTAKALVSRSRGAFEAFVGLRYLKAKKSQSFISAITLLSILGVMVGVCALVVVLSVMSGFEDDLKGKILGTNSHAVVLKYGGDITDYREVMKKTLEVPDVVGSTPFVYSEVMLTTATLGSGVILKGIDPATVGTVTDLVKSLTFGPDGPLNTLEEKQKAIEALDRQGRDGEDGASTLPGLLVGQELALTSHILVGDTVTVVSPLGEIGPMGTRVPKFRQFRVVGIFHSGMYEYDAKFTYTSLSAAQRFLSMGDAVTGIELKVSDIYLAKEIAQLVDARLGYPYWTRDWMSMNKNLFSALYLEKIVMAVILGMIIAVAALNIISTLIMGVIEKGKEIAILKTVGATGMQIMKVFMIEGLIIGFIGTTLGLVLGFVLCYILDKTQLIRLNPDVYYLDTLPVQISASMFALVALAAMTISFVAALYPSWRASRQDPVEGLRYE